MVEEKRAEGENMVAMELDGRWVWLCFFVLSSVMFEDGKTFALSNNMVRLISLGKSCGCRN